MKKSVYLTMLLTLSAVLATGCETQKQPANDTSNLEASPELHEKECLMGATFNVLEKSDVTYAEEGKSFIVASEFQSNPVLLSVGAVNYQTMEVGKSYYITFEGTILVPDIDLSLIQTTFALSELQVQSVKEVQPQGVENEHQPLTCK